ncbi:uncharacterized protein LOC107368450 [Tetranychus urticae]|uniref:uncharacterized protein LOC107368450 n=1 Tax=Tetranychus urticae TaxID=32264 RepID=UPI00077BB496|nr:uncharacterized protein LOC107368450 [Tetranychus urticae]
MRFLIPRSDQLLTVIKYLGRRLASTDPRSKSSFIRDKTHVNVCCLGHTGHGKTTLSSAITLVQSKLKRSVYKPIDQIDKSPDEKARGQSIVPCKIEFTSASKHYVLTDLPGAKDLIKNTIFGACGSDVAIIVVNCQEGPSEQTRKHLAIARHHGVEHFVGFINQFGEADMENVELCELATREMLVEEGLDGDAIHFIHGSAVKALKEDTNELESIEKLITILDTLPSPDRNLDCSGLLYIDKIYSPPGRGTGVTGTVKQGKLTKGQIIDCLGFDRHIKTKINYIECFNKVLDETIEGDSVEIVLQGVKRDDITRGMAVCPSGEFSQCNNLEVLWQFFNSSHRSDALRGKFVTTNMLNFHFETGDVVGQIILSPGKDYITSGQSDLSQVKLSRSCVLSEGQSLLLRDGNEIVGLGKINRLLDNINKEEQKKILKGRNRIEREQFKSLLDKIESENEH